MTYLAIGIIGIFCLLNLALTLGLVRQMRRYSDVLDARHTAGGSLWHLKAGTRAPDFTAVTTTGQTHSLHTMAGKRVLIAFFSVVCPPCWVQARLLREYARSPAADASQVLAVICGQGTAASEFARELEGTMPVVVEPPHGPTPMAFAVSSYPTFYVIGADGDIEASAMAIADLPAPARV